MLQSSATSPSQTTVASNDSEKGERTPTNEFPEGGVQGWCTVVGAMIFQFCSFGTLFLFSYTNAYAVYQDYYARIYIHDASPSAIAWIGSTNGFVVVASGVLVGMLYDRGYFYHLLYGGSFLISFCLFMLSITQSDHFYQVFLVQGIGLGIGAGLTYVPSVAVVSHYFQKKRPLAMMLVVAGSSIGAIVHPIMLNNLLARFSFRQAVGISAGMITLLLVLACSLTRPRLPSPKVKAALFPSIRRFYNEPAYALLSIGGFLFMLGFYFPLFYFQLDVIKHGLDPHFAVYAIVILNGSGFIGRIIPGLFANSLGVLNMVVASAVGCTIFIFMMMTLKTTASAIILAMMYGFFSGAFITLQVPLIALMTTDLSEIGLRIGVCYAVSSFGTLTGPPIHGALLTNDFLWWRPVVFSGVLTSMGTVCFAFLIPLLKKSSH
ncbi:MFS general substrate transporter [Panaeolus papilionaceus]|nr:MFS general substrate transporter [Panaeolus papilionaceus]